MKTRFLMGAGFALIASACEPKAADEGAASNESAKPAETTTATATAPGADLGKAFPAAFRGKWDGSAEACKTGSERKLNITETEMQFLESIGVAKSIAQESENAIKVDAAFSGEGETWDATTRLELSPAGNALTINGDQTSQLVRCS
jgi:hypothetical protein